MSYNDKNLLKQNYIPYFVNCDQMLLEDTHVWFVGREDNTIYEGNLESGIYKFVAHLPQKKGYLLNPICVKIDNKLYCIPVTGNKIWVFHTEKKTVEEIVIPTDSSEHIRMEYAGEYEGFIYFVGKGIKKIFQIEKDTLKLRKIYPFYTENERCGFEIALVNQKLYCTSQNSNRICEFDLQKEEIKYYELPFEERGIGSICFDGKDFWMTGFDKKIYRWNISHNCSMSFGDFPSGFCIDLKGDDGYTPFYKSIVCKKNIWFIPNNRPNNQYGGMIALDRVSKEITEFRLPDRDNTVCGAFIIPYVRDERYLGVLFWGDQFICNIDTENLNIEQKEMWFCKEDFSKIWFYNNSMISEKHPMDLQIFLDISRNTAENQLFCANTDGKKIYRSICDF